MENKLLLIASELLDIAHLTFMNHGCNDLPLEFEELSSSEICKDFTDWYDPGLEIDNIAQMGDDTLMRYLSVKLKEIATQNNVFDFEIEKPDKDGHYLVFSRNSYPKNSKWLVAEYYLEDDVFYSESSDDPIDDVEKWAYLPKL
jgi:hypothetical protein